MPGDLRAIVEACWAQQAADRPSMESVVDMLKVAMQARSLDTTPPQLEASACSLATLPALEEAARFGSGGDSSGLAARPAAPADKAGNGDSFGSSSKRSAGPACCAVM